MSTPKKRLTKAEIRITIAKDAIKWIKLGKVVMTSNEYVRMPDMIRVADGNTQARDALKDVVCRTCELGAAFVVALDRFDKLKVQDLFRRDYTTANEMGWKINDVDSTKTKKYLERFFSVEQLGTLEWAFEGWSHGQWKRKYPILADRATAIWKNMIKNGGTFKPNQLKVKFRTRKEAAQ